MHLLLVFRLCERLLSTRIPLAEVDQLTHKENIYFLMFTCALYRKWLDAKSSNDARKSWAPTPSLLLWGSAAT